MGAWGENLNDIQSSMRTRKQAEYKRKKEYAGEIKYRKNEKEENFSRRVSIAPFFTCDF